MRVFHHTDADGKCAAYWIHKRYPHLTEKDFTMIDYGMNIDVLSIINKDEPIIIVDFSFEPEMMRKIMKITKNIIWIDHHMSAIKKYEGFEEEIKGLRYDGIAGCMLTWAYFNKMNDGRESFDPKMCNEAPWMTKYVHDHDVWKYEYGDETAHFKLGLEAEGNIDPFNPVWDSLVEDHGKVKKLIENGSIIAKYRDAIGNRVCNMYGFEYNFENLKLFCLNNVFGGSEWFGEIIKKYDAVCVFHYMGKEKIFEYSVYSEKENVNCVDIVQKLFGPESGGHKGAAGGTSKKLIFTN